MIEPGTPSRLPVNTATFLAGPAGGFGRCWRIRRRRDFLRAQGQGRKLATDHFLIFSIPNGLDHPRLGITVSRKVGNAVTRNRVKRLVREVFRVEKRSFSRGRDVVVIARTMAGGVSLVQVRAELLGYCRRTQPTGPRGNPPPKAAATDK